MNFSFNKIWTVSITMLLGLSWALFTSPMSSRADVQFETLPSAAVYSDFVVGPGKVEAELGPGETQTFELSVANRLGTDKNFILSTEDFTGSEDPKQTVVLLGDDHGPYSLKDFIKPATTSVMIPTGVKAHIPVVISIPKDAQPGGLYGSVVIGTATVTTGTAANGARATSPLITRIGTLFFVRVKGPVVERGHLEDFSIAGGKGFLFQSQSILFDILFRNEGNVHLDPKGTITVTNMLGSTVGSFEVEPWFAMPKSLRFREVTWNPPFLFGRYVAHAEIHRGYGSDIDKGDIVFWVIPWKVIVGVLLGLIIVIAAIRFVVSRFSITMKRPNNKTGKNKDK
jgi:hypothetical protein